jgi:hypothetical protein
VEPNGLIKDENVTPGFSNAAIYNRVHEVPHAVAILSWVDACNAPGCSQPPANDLEHHTRRLQELTALPGIEGRACRSQHFR